MLRRELYGEKTSDRCHFWRIGWLGKGDRTRGGKKGATVVFLARRRDKLRQAQAEATALSGHPAYAFPVDVGDPVAIEAAVDQIHETVGPVDVLVNAAGFGHFENAFDTDMRLVERMFRVNVLGVMYLTKLLGRDMAISGQGQIINVASMAGKMATPKSAIYSATKSAVIGYSNGLRLELKPFGVHVTTVNPGPIATDFSRQPVLWIILQPFRGWHWIRINLHAESLGHLTIRCGKSMHRA